ncbi:MAG: hypothetical protein ACYS99_09340 [Planctomycetota bacterium]
MSGGNRHELKWQLFRSFFTSRAAFLVLFEGYEERVLDFAGRFKTDRSRLKLAADDLQTLLDFKGLEELRDREILTLKETAHELFRESDSTDRFDHYVSNIYHEISMLKEEHYTLNEEFVRADAKEYQRFFREVSEFYPKRLRHIRNLYGKALRRLEQLLPNFAQERVLVRSIYLFGDQLLAGNYPRGLTGLYRKMYPELGEVEGFTTVGRSFLESGFAEEAREAFQKALEAGKKAKRRRRSERLPALLGEIGAHLEELEAALAE